LPAGQAGPTSEVSEGVADLLKMLMLFVLHLSGDLLEALSAPFLVAILKKEKRKGHEFKGIEQERGQYE